MRRRALLPMALATILAAFVTPRTAIAQPVPAIDAPPQPFVQITGCNVQRLYAPGAFSSPALYHVGPEVLDDVDADGPLFELLLPAPIGGALSIHYMNATTRVMKSIAFGLVVGGALVTEVRDAGKFTPNAEIDHEFVIDAGVFPLGSEPPHCIALTIAYTDGTAWRNPNVPPALKRGGPSKGASVGQSTDDIASPPG